MLITSSLNTALTWRFLPIVLSLCLLKSIEQNKKNVVIGVVYRPQDRIINDFNQELDQLVSIVSKENKTVFLLGDWNLNLMNHLHHQATSDFLELLFSRMVFPMITRPTCITSHTASLINNIFTGEPLNKCTSGLFLNTVTFRIIFLFLQLYLGLNRPFLEIITSLFVKKLGNT